MLSVPPYPGDRVIRDPDVVRSGGDERRARLGGRGVGRGGDG